MLLQQQAEKDLFNKISEFNQLYNPLAQSVAAAKLQHQSMKVNVERDVVDDGAHDKILGKKMQLENML